MNIDTSKVYGKTLNFEIDFAENKIHDTKFMAIEKNYSEFCEVKNSVSKPMSVLKFKHNLSTIFS